MTNFIKSELSRLLNSYNYKVEYMRRQDNEDEYYGDMEIILIIVTTFYLKELLDKEKLEQQDIDFVNSRKLIYDDEILSSISKKYNIDIRSLYSYDEIQNRIYNIYEEPSSTVSLDINTDDDIPF